MMFPLRLTIFYPCSNRNEPWGMNSMDKPRDSQNEIKAFKQSSCPNTWFHLYYIMKINLSCSSIVFYCLSKTKSNKRACSKRSNTVEMPAVQYISVSFNLWVSVKCAAAVKIMRFIDALYCQPCEVNLSS